MANAQQLRRRIQTASNVSKTTKAMQMIAASKLKRAQDATLSARPYVDRLTILSKTVTFKLGEIKNVHPYLKLNKDNNKTLLLVLAPDKGLCGSLITNLLKTLIDFNKENDAMFLTIGKKIEHKTAILNKEIIAAFPFGTTLPTFGKVLGIAKFVKEYFLNGSVGKVTILSTNFKSIFSQKPEVIQLLPIAFSGEKEKQSFSLFEPEADKLIAPLLEHYLEMVIYQHLLESFVSEQAARMLSMQNATNNALDIIEDLKLLYNKNRQEKITNEILDISSAKVME